jgi:hypothetical protein
MLSQRFNNIFLSMRLDPDKNARRIPIKLALPNHYSVSRATRNAVVKRFATSVMPA